MIPRSRILALGALTSLIALMAGGCHTSAVDRRVARNQATYHSLTAEERSWVDHGRIETGMTTNAVILIMGLPAEVVHAEHDAEEHWRYYADYVRHDPFWRSIPSANGFPTLELYYNHSSWRYLKSLVVFADGRVVRWRFYEPAL